MEHQVIYTKSALRDLKKLSKKVSKRVTDKIEFYCLHENFLLFAKRLSGTKSEEYRFRVGNYRILFNLDDNGNMQILMILAVKHRREVYKTL